MSWGELMEIWSQQTGVDAIVGKERTALMGRYLMFGVRAASDVMPWVAIGILGAWKRPEEGKERDLWKLVVWGWPMLLVVFGPLLRAIFLYGGVGIHPDFQPERLIGAVLFVGITEEIVFRGFLLNALLQKMKLWSAIAVNEVFFVLIHFPIWIYQGKDLVAFAGSSVVVFLLGGLFSYSFVKTRNIFVPIVLHMIYNLLVVVFLG